ncbi:hypothetical protein AVEN_24391-1 [Araneus ventricosus]|uniref:CCHC-type domain-containing protein n=1 Tax=Araneus ventricosus TaxID=182803 RepID=A0A4Y2Q8I5_ARAVE|nr:hypothetical protein AVEN_24391-1 [Araneus ventricosus]
MPRAGGCLPLLSSVRLSENNETFTNVSPFLVEKAITGSVGIVTSTKLRCSGDLLVEVASRKQAQQILSINFLSNIPVSVQQHETLNTSKDVITYGRLLNLPIEEITQELSGQGVKDLRRINIRRDVNLPYIPNPLRCFKCQRFDHSKTNSLETLTCVRCAVAGHESTGCTAVEKWVNCQGKHTSFSRSCPKWKQEKEVVATKYQNISFPEARRLVKAQTPPVGRSYASVVAKNHPVYETTDCPHCNHGVTMSNFPSTSKSPKPVAISSSYGTENRILSEPISETCEVPPASQDSSGFKLLKQKKKNPKILLKLILLTITK